ncbi:MAG: hypothetical protein ACE37F_17045 [Nannocystaceae bacterium]|nr:hypothetical protein [bacterium]
MRTSRCTLTLAFLLALTAGCDAKDEPAQEAKEEAKEQASEEADAAGDGKGNKEKKDRGSATVTIGGTKWAAGSCRAKPKKDTLKITCSKTNMVDGKIDREAIDLLLKDYEGPGDYKAAPGMSNFTGVGFDAKKAEEADDPDKAAKDAVTKAVTGAKVIMLGGMEVKVTTVEGGFVDGTFSMPAGGAMGGPAFEDGTFHARLLEEKK